MTRRMQFARLTPIIRVGKNRVKTQPPRCYSPQRGRHCEFATESSTTNWLVAESAGMRVACPNFGEFGHESSVHRYLRFFGARSDPGSKDFRGRSTNSWSGVVIASPAPRSLPAR